MTIRDNVIKTLKEQTPYLQTRFGIIQLRLFGSVSRGEDTQESDIDLLYIFKPEAENYHNLFELHQYLTQLFGRKIDLVSEEWSTKQFLSCVSEDAVLCTTGA